MNCKQCGKPVELFPSAKERAAKYGGTPADYTRLFPYHTACQLQLREQRVRELMQRGAR